MSFIGHKNNEIKIISEQKFTSSELSVIEVPDGISGEDIYCKYRIRNNKLVIKKPFGDTSGLKIAFVTNWNMACGIASYAKSLFLELAKQFKDYKLFIEDNGTTGDNIIACWKRGQDCSELVKQLKNYEPDIILINHEWGLFPNASVWLSLITQLNDYRVIVIMHSVFHHADKTICEAAMPEIVTHLEGGRRVLKEEKEISANVSVIPHGCDKFNGERFWNLYHTEHCILQVGFGLRYKNFQDTIKATAILKQKYDDIFLTAVFSESPYGKMDHQKYYNELVGLVDELGINKNVGIIRGFQSDTVINSYMRTNNVAIFPYVSQPNHEVFGSTGIAREAMSRGLPVISSSINHFSDLPTMKADSPVEIAKAVEILFEDKEKRLAQIQVQKEYTERYSWGNIAEMWKRVFTKVF
jgi:glycosyltransferase involved in cell wall biosynthesis